MFQNHGFLQNHNFIRDHPVRLGHVFLKQIGGCLKARYLEIHWLIIIIYILLMLFSGYTDRLRPDPKLHHHCPGGQIPKFHSSIQMSSVR